MAVDPFNIKTFPKNENDIEILTIDGNIPPFDIEDYKDDEQGALIKDVERLCRGAFEYQYWVSYLRDYMNLNKCAFFKNITNVDTFSIKIHLHHTPITLMEMVMIILDKRKFYRESLLIEDISREVMYNHYCLAVGIIPVCETVHELIHNEYLFVPNSSVLGAYNSFLQMYSPWIPLEIKMKLDRIEDWSYFYDEESNTNIIKSHYIYLDLGDNGVGYNIPKMQDVAMMVQRKLEYIRNNGFQSGPIQLVTYA